MIFELHPSFALLLLILAAFAGFHPQLLAGIMLSILAHEAGHFLAARAAGVPVKALGANWMGCFIRREDSQRPALEIAIAAAGLLVTLLLALATSGMVARFNWALLVANALPVSGSDGGRILKNLKRFKKLKQLQTA